MFLSISQIRWRLSKNCRRYYGREGSYLAVSALSRMKSVRYTSSRISNQASDDCASWVLSKSGKTSGSGATKSFKNPTTHEGILTWIRDRNYFNLVKFLRLSDS